MSEDHSIHYYRQLCVEGDVYVVGEDGCLIAIEVSLLPGPTSSVAQNPAGRSLKSRVPVTLFVRRFFKHCQTCFRELSDGRRRVHRYHRLARMKLVGEPGSRAFAESYLKAQQVLTARSRGEP